MTVEIVVTPLTPQLVVVEEQVTPPEVVVAPVGLPGPAGAQPASYSFTNAATWLVQHNLGRVPLVQIVVAGEVWDADIEVVDVNSFYVTWPAPQTGTVTVL